MGFIGQIASLAGQLTSLAGQPASLAGQSLGIKKTSILGLSVASGLSQAYFKYQTGQYEAKVAKANQKIATMQAEDALERGQEEESKHRKEVQQLLGQQRAAMAAQGLDLESGSALDIQEDTAYMGELDALTIRNNAAREAWGYRVEAANYEAQEKAAKSQAISGSINTILTTGAQGLSSYYLLKRGMGLSG